MKTCKTCKHWIDATAECSVELKCICSDWDVCETVTDALESDPDKKNECEYYV